VTSDDHRAPLVSVVIPTTGRAELSRAIESARNQAGQLRVEIIVVNDNLDEDAVGDVDADKVIWTGGARRGGHARNLGVLASSGDFVAFLDDDDEWIPTKLRDQLLLMGSAPNPSLVVVSGRHVHVQATTGRTSRPGPDRLIRAGQPVDEYLFRRRRPSGGRASMYTSTLLCSKELATRVPWREELVRHQDWDWLVRLSEVPGVTFTHCPQVVTRIQTGSPGSISASVDWSSSLEWADNVLKNDAVAADFLVAQTLRYAISAHSLVGVRLVARRIAARRRVPSLGPMVIGLLGFVPRRRLEGLMTRGVRSVSGRQSGSRSTDGRGLAKAIRGMNARRSRER